MDFLTYFDGPQSQLSPLPQDDLDSYFSFLLGEAPAIATVPSQTGPNRNTCTGKRKDDVRRQQKVEEEEDTTVVIASNENKRLCVGLEKGVRQPARRLWVKDRSQAWWKAVNDPHYPDSEFRKAFRMSRATFDLICDELSPAIAKEDTMLRTAIPVRQRVAVCIWRLATGEPLRVVSGRFGLGISTCHKIVLEVCSAIRTVLMPKFIRWPDASNLDFVKSRFESVSGIPDVVGSMYTTHIPIVAPKSRVTDYLNRRQTEKNQKTSYSVTVQGVVDPNGVFTDLCIGWPGGMSDEQVLENSVLYQRGGHGGLQQTTHQQQQLRNWVLGGVAYPLLDWLLVPYARQNLTWTQHAFNEKAEEVRRVAAEAFGRLKGRWKYLQKRTEVKLEDLPMVLAACCVLHNVCELRKEEMEPELTFELADDPMVAEDGLRSEAALLARDTIAHELLHHGRARGAGSFY